MSTSIRAAQIAGLGLLMLGGCTVNNPPAAQVVVREQPAATTTIVTPARASTPSTVVLQPRY